MNPEPFVTAALVLIGWLWSLRAGGAIQRYSSEGSVARKRVAVGNTIVSAIPLALAVWIAWPR